MKIIFKFHVNLREWKKTFSFQTPFAPSMVSFDSKVQFLQHKCCDQLLEVLEKHYLHLTSSPITFGVSFSCVRPSQCLRASSRLCFCNLGPVLIPRPTRSLVAVKLKLLWRSMNQWSSSKNWVVLSGIANCAGTVRMDSKVLIHVKGHTDLNDLCQGNASFVTTISVWHAVQAPSWSEPICCRNVSIRFNKGNAF